MLFLTFSVLPDDSSPRYWAAFIPLGEADDMVFARKEAGSFQRWSWVLVAATALTVFLASLFILRRRWSR